MYTVCASIYTHVYNQSNTVMYVFMYTSFPTDTDNTAGHTMRSKRIDKNKICSQYLI